MTALPPLDTATLPPGIRARFVEGVNGLRMHVLECGERGRPCLLLLHGFPELAYSWRKVMPTLAAAGYYVIAPDQRGYGRTTGSDDSYDTDLTQYGPFNLVRDVVGLVYALGIREVAAIIGHDFGATVAAYGALLRPDLFRSVSLMSAPFSGPPTIPIGSADNPDAKATRESAIHEELAALERPRKHYHAYYWTREANPNMHGAKQGVQAFLRATGRRTSRSASRVGLRPSSRKYQRTTSWISATAWPRPLPRRRRARPRLPPTSGCRKPRCAYSARNMRGPPSKAGSTGIARASIGASFPSWSYCPAARSTYPRASLRDVAIGASTRCRAPSSVWDVGRVSHRGRRSLGAAGTPRGNRAASAGVPAGAALNGVTHGRHDRHGGTGSRTGRALRPVSGPQPDR